MHYSLKLPKWSQNSRGLAHLGLLDHVYYGIAKNRVVEKQKDQLEFVGDENYFVLGDVEDLKYKWRGMKFLCR
jgi:hypothetical protein